MEGVRKYIVRIIEKIPYGFENLYMWLVKKGCTESERNPYKEPVIVESGEIVPRKEIIEKVIGKIALPSSVDGIEITQKSGMIDFHDPTSAQEIQTKINFLYENVLQADVIEIPGVDGRPGVDPSLIHKSGVGT